jgi:hypothetical protein
MHYYQNRQSSHSSGWVSHEAELCQDTSFSYHVQETWDAYLDNNGFSSRSASDKSDKDEQNLHK